MSAREIHCSAMSDQNNQEMLLKRREFGLE